MAGHSKWANIKHRKAAQDAKRAKVWTKIIKEVSVAVKTGGGSDPDSNPRLRLAIQNARGANVPKDNIQRAIDKASGAAGEDYTEVSFEGYGPEGVAVYVECMTDNNTRTVAAVRSYFNKYQGSLGKDGCLQFIFERKGVFHVSADALDKMDFDEFSLELIDAGAWDIEEVDGYIIITSMMENFGLVQSRLSELKIETEQAGLERIPTTYKSISKEAIPSFWKLIDALEDNDDVQKVYHNLEISETE